MQNARRGDYSRQRLRGKRVLELGAGMGLCSLALAVQGAHVIVTDLAPVLPLLRANCESNLSPSAISGLTCNSSAFHLASFLSAHLPKVLDGICDPAITLGVVFLPGNVRRKHT